MLHESSAAQRSQINAPSGCSLDSNSANSTSATHQEHVSGSVSFMASPITQGRRMVSGNIERHARRLLDRIAVTPYPFGLHTRRLVVVPKPPLSSHCESLVARLCPGVCDPCQKMPGGLPDTYPYALSGLLCSYQISCAPAPLPRPCRAGRAVLGASCRDCHPARVTYPSVGYVAHAGRHSPLVPRVRLARFDHRPEPSFSTLAVWLLPSASM